MNGKFKLMVSIISVFALALLLFTGTALADPVTPEDGSGLDASQSRISQMIERMGPENWARMIQRMTQIHGAEFTGQMLQRMNGDGSCHDSEHTGPGSMMGRGFGRGMWNGNDNGQGTPGFQNGMAGRGMNW